jgi:WD40 repeat protein
VIVSGSADRSVRIWNPATGMPIGEPLTGHTDSVLSVAVGEIKGRTVIVSGSADRSVRIWDPATGALIGEPLTGRDRRAVHTDRIGQTRKPGHTGHTGPVTSVATGYIEGRPVIISGSADRSVRIWDAVTRTLMCKPLTGHTGPVTSVRARQLEGHSVIASVASNTSVRLWQATFRRRRLRTSVLNLNVPPSPGSREPAGAETWWNSTLMSPNTLRWSFPSKVTAISFAWHEHCVVAFGNEIALFQQRK